MIKKYEDILNQIVKEKEMSVPMSTNSRTLVVDGL